MNWVKFAAVSAALLAGGCAGGGYSWQRSDGGPINQWAFDRAIGECRDRAADRQEPERAMKLCMARRGYVWTAGGYAGEGYYPRDSYPREYPRRRYYRRDYDED